MSSLIFFVSRSHLIEMWHHELQMQNTKIRSFIVHNQNPVSRTAVPRHTSWEIRMRGPKDYGKRNDKYAPQLSGTALLQTSSACSLKPSSRSGLLFMFADGSLRCLACSRRNPYNNMCNFCPSLCAFVGGSPIYGSASKRWGELLWYYLSMRYSSACVYNFEIINPKCNILIFKVPVEVKLLL